MNETTGIETKVKNLFPTSLHINNCISQGQPEKKIFIFINISHLICVKKIIYIF